jgi:hypothetical protein
VPIPLWTRPRLGCSCEGTNSRCSIGILVSHSESQAHTLTMLDHNSDAYELQIRQGPERARVAGAKEKGEYLFILDARLLGEVGR